jgi:streptomycin 6-kinase
LIDTRSSWLLPVRRDHTAAILKIFKPHSDEHNAAALIRYWNGRGAVRLWEADENALLVERAIGSHALTEMALTGADLEAAAILAQTIADLHAHRSASVPDGLVPMKEQFLSLFTREPDIPILGRCVAVARELLATEREVVPLHGDLHHGNVLDGGHRGWLAIDPKGVLGERTYKVANLLCNPRPHGVLVHRADRMQRLASFYAARLKARCAARAWI